MVMLVVLEIFGFLVIVICLLMVFEGKVWLCVMLLVLYILV